MKMLKIAFGVAAGALLMWLLTSPSRVPQEPVDQAKLYCKMVHAGNWPDFHNVYKQQCHKDGTVNMKYITGSDE